ncbi:MAG TPA: hypothetical protein VF473_11075 [Cyclobacteriaceae bacterium]
MKKHTKRSSLHAAKPKGSAKPVKRQGKLEDTAWYKKKMQDANDFMARAGLPKGW